jgi:hypothetical protein
MSPNAAAFLSVDGQIRQIDAHTTYAMPSRFITRAEKLWANFQASGERMLVDVRYPYQGFLDAGGKRCRNQPDAIKTAPNNKNIRVNACIGFSN